jgi:serpin B
MHMPTFRLLALPAALALVFSAAADARPLHHGSPKAHVAPPSFAAGPATTAFGLDLLRRLGNGNVVFSPDSIATAIAMAGTGAAGNTASQMASTLRLASPAAFAKVGDLQREIADEQTKSAHGDPEAPTLDIADTLFLQRDFGVEAPFLTRLRQHFGSTPQLVDFQEHSAEATQKVNSWASEQTHGLIAKLVGSLDKSTRLLLMNAVYLKAAWKFPFSPEATESATFHGASGDVSVPFMHGKSTWSYAEGHGYQALSLPYRSSTLSLLVLLPTGRGTGTLLRSLSATTLGRISRGLKSRQVQLSLPRFHLHLQAELNKPLEALGMDVPFQRHADFSPITNRELEIGLVEHAADLTVDESGTVGAAATAVGILEPTGVGPQPTRFNANRPFLFFLRDDRTGALLFAGRLADPSSAH